MSAPAVAKAARPRARAAARVSVSPISIAGISTTDWSSSSRRRRSCRSSRSPSSSMPVRSAIRAAAKAPRSSSAKLMLEGTQKSDGAELTERFERLGATIDAQADWDAAAFTMTALAEHLPAAFDLLGEVLRTPAFRPREVARLKAERIAELLQLRAEPRGLADELFAPLSLSAVVAIRAPRRR